MNSRSGGQRHATQPGGPSSAAHPAAADAVDADRSHGLPAQALRVTARVTVTVMSPPAPGDQAADVARDPVAALTEFIALPDTVLSWDRNAEDNGDAQGPDVGCPGCGPGGSRQAHLGGEPGALAQRIAAALAQQDPGWLLPRSTVLAKRFGVCPADVDAAVSDLVSRHLVRGRFRRSTSADYVVPLTGRPALAVRVEPRSGPLTRTAR